MAVLAKILFWNLQRRLLSACIWRQATTVCQISIQSELLWRVQLIYNRHKCLLILIIRLLLVFHAFRTQGRCRILLLLWVLRQFSYWFLFRLGSKSWYFARHLCKHSSYWKLFLDSLFLVPTSSVLSIVLFVLRWPLKSRLRVNRFKLLSFQFNSFTLGEGFLSKLGTNLWLTSIGGSRTLASTSASFPSMVYFFRLRELTSKFWTSLLNTDHFNIRRHQSRLAGKGMWGTRFARSSPT